MLICDECMECCHIEDHYEKEWLNIGRCALCYRDVDRLYEMGKEHIRELMKKYKELLSQIEVDKLI